MSKSEHILLTWYGSTLGTFAEILFGSVEMALTITVWIVGKTTCKMRERKRNVTTTNEWAQLRWKQITIGINLCHSYCCYLLPDSIADFILTLSLSSTISSFTRNKWMRKAQTRKQTLSEGDTKQIIIACLFGTKI